MQNTALNKLLSESESLHKIDNVMATVIQDISIKHLFALLSQRKNIEEIVIMSNDDNSKKLVLAKKAIKDEGDTKLGFYVTSDRPNKPNTPMKQLQSTVATLFTKRLQKEEHKKEFILAKRVAGLSEQKDLKTMVETFHLTPDILEQKTRGAIEKTISPWKREMEDRIDGPDGYTPKERELCKEQYDFDISILTLIEACKNLEIYKKLQKKDEVFTTREVVGSPISSN